MLRRPIDKPASAVCVDSMGCWGDSVVYGCDGYRPI